MSAAQRIADASVALAHLAAASEPVEVTRSGIDAALHGRQATLALAQQMTSDLTGKPLTRRPDLSDLHTRPDQALAWYLHNQPRIHASQSSIDIARAAAPTSVTGRWERLAALATDAHLQWTHAPNRPTATSGASARGALEYAVALVTTITSFDAAVRRSAQLTGASGVAAALSTARTHELQLAAAATLHDLAGQDAVRWDAVRPPDVRTLTVLPVADLTGLPRGLHRLRQLLDAGARIGPAETATLITAQTRMAVQLHTRAAHVATVTGNALHGRVADVLAHHARAMASTWDRRDNTLVAVTRADPRPVLQAGECLRAVTAHARSPLPARLLHQSVEQLLHLAAATCLNVDHQVQSGTWCAEVADERSTTLARTWRPTTTTAAPHVISALHDIQRHVPLALASIAVPARPAVHAASLRPVAPPAHVVARAHGR